jgi:hypothetical protein
MLYRAKRIAWVIHPPNGLRFPKAALPVNVGIRPVQEHFRQPGGKVRGSDRRRVAGFSG